MDNHTTEEARRGDESQREIAKRAAFTAAWPDYMRGHIGSEAFFGLAFDAGEKFAFNPQAGAAGASACGGCGNTDSEKRCINCMHDFQEARAYCEATTELSLPELAEEFAAVAKLGGKYTLSADACAMLYRAMTTGKSDLEADTGVAGAGEQLVQLIEQAMKIPKTLATRTIELTPIQIAWIAAQFSRQHEATIADLRAKLARQRQDSKPTDLSKRLRESANAVMLADDRARLMTKAADEIERHYGGMLAWERSAEAKDAEAAQRQGEPVATVPEGWPTKEMIHAGWKAGLSGRIGSGFRAMLEAAPTIGTVELADCGTCGGQVTVPVNYFAATTPQADTATVRDAARYRWLVENVCTGSIGFDGWWINADEPAAEWDAAIDAVMRTTAADNQTNEQSE